MSSSNKAESYREDIWRLTVAYFKSKDNLGYPPADASAYGFRFGMAVALKHPEYAQAFVRLLSSPMSNLVEGMIGDEFVETVPLEGELEDVVPSGE